MASNTEEKSAGQSQRVKYHAYAPESGFIDELQANLMEFLLAVHKEHIHPHLAYCLQEILDNAVRANLKRVFFQEKQLDLNDPAQYAQGMELFKTEFIGNRGYWVERLRELHSHSVTVEFCVSDEELSMFVINTAAIMPHERERINKRLDKARIYESVAEIFDEVSDDSESGGLGIVMLCMILRKLGLSEDCFVLEESEGETAVGIHIPLGSLTDEESETVSTALAKEIDSIPQFPDNILKLKKMLSSADTDFQAVANLLKRDPALTAEVLRMCNSAYYRRRQKIESCQLAISILGVRGLRSILDSFGARQALAQRFSPEKLERLWTHSTEVADVTSALCTRYAVPPEQTELAYNGALLHEIGRIVLEGRHPNTCAALDSLCSRKAVSVNAVEDLIEGVNHTMIGAALAAKWNLPEALVDSLKFYRTPRSAPPAVQRACALVYLAHCLTEQMHGRYEEFFPKNLPDQLNLSKTDTLPALLEEQKKKKEVF